MAEVELPVTHANFLRNFDLILAPWIKAMGLCEFEVSDGCVKAILPQNPELQFSSGALCGQAL
jgi:hypothetical protein